MKIKTAVILIGCTSVVVAIATLCVNGYHFLQSLPPIKNVPIWQTGPLPPIDYKKLSEGKVTHYFVGGDNPNSPTQVSMLEACRELPIHDATARSASVVIGTREYGEMPVDALVVDSTVFVSLGQVLRALRTGYMDEGEGTVGMFPFVGRSNHPSPGSIRLFPQKKWAVIGSKRALVNNSGYEYIGGEKIALQQPVYWTEGRDLVITLSDLRTIFHAGDVQRGGPPTLLSSEVSYEPNSYKLYHPAP